MNNTEDRKKKFLEYCNKNTDVLNVEKFVYEYFLTLSLYRPDNNKDFWYENIAELKKTFNQEVDYWLNNTNKLYEYHTYKERD